MPNIETLQAPTLVVAIICGAVMIAAIIYGIATDKRTKNGRPVVLRSNFPVL
jgi:hypothetical protein